MTSDLIMTAKGTAATPVSQRALEVRLDHFKVQMRKEIYDCLGSKHFRNLVKIEVYKVLQGCLIFVGVIGVVFIVFLNLTKLADKDGDALVPTTSFSEGP